MNEYINKTTFSKHIYVTRRLHPLLPQAWLLPVIPPPRISIPYPPQEREGSPTSLAQDRTAPSISPARVTPQEVTTLTKIKIMAKKWAVTMWVWWCPPRPPPTSCYPLPHPRLPGTSTAACAPLLPFPTPPHAWFWNVSYVVMINAP